MLRGAGGRFVGQVDVQKICGEALAGELERETCAGLIVDIEEDDGRFLPREVAHDRSADSCRTARDQNDLASQQRPDKRPP